MGYKEQFDQYRKNGKKNTLTPVVHQWTEVNEVLVGKLVGIEVAKSSKGKGNFLIYKLETDEGTISTTLGASIDRNIDLKPHIGEIVAIEYLGKKDLKGGKRLNMFSVEVVPCGESDEQTTRNNASRNSSKKKFEE